MYHDSKNSPHHDIGGIKNQDHNTLWQLEGSGKLFKQTEAPTQNWLGEWRRRGKRARKNCPTLLERPQAQPVLARHPVPNRSLFNVHKYVWNYSDVKLFITRIMETLHAIDWEENATLLFLKRAVSNDARECSHHTLRLCWPCCTNLFIRRSIMYPSFSSSWHA